MTLKSDCLERTSKNQMQDNKTDFKIKIEAVICIDLQY